MHTGGIIYNLWDRLKVVQIRITFVLWHKNWLLSCGFKKELVEVQKYGTIITIL